MLRRLSVQEQIANLKRATRFSWGRNLHHWLVGIASGLLLLSLVIWHPIPLMLALFLGVIGIAERTAIPNVLNALEAYDTQPPSRGKVGITVSHWSDSSDHFHVVVSEPGHPDWTYEFIPQGWIPTLGSHPASIWRQGETGTPVLAIVDDGILIPRYPPQKGSGAETG
jgi:hypothetical protein